MTGHRRIVAAVAKALPGWRVFVSTWKPSAVPTLFATHDLADRTGVLLSGDLRGNEGAEWVRRFARKAKAGLRRYGGG